ncbi:MAG: DUF6259 domain-containing protein [Bacteroidota bacterium]|nr:DUF6259 domain-containing protein [Bacteroidota bacterium]
MKRRNFIRKSGGILAFTPLASSISHMDAGSKPVKGSVIADNYISTVSIRDNGIYIDTATLSATISGGLLTSLKNKKSGEEYINEFNTADHAALQLIYPGNEIVEFNEKNFTRIRLHQVSDQRVEIFFNCWHGDGVVSIYTDDMTGDLLVEPSAFSSRPGVIACRWNIPGIRPELDLVAPFFQGIKLKLDDKLISNTRWPWPFYWEAGLAIIQSPAGGFCIYTRDNKYRYKALKVGSANYPFVLGLDSEAYGPIDNNLAAGGLCWRINVFEGDWHVPARKYREWLWAAYELEKAEANRRSWINNIRLALSWCPGDPAILDALSKKISPSKVLIHYPDWRTDKYDQNYPDYNPSEKGRAFIKKCQQDGFHVMPHFNANDMDPSNPVYNLIRDFQYRDLETKQIKGWSWIEGRSIGVPESNFSRMYNRENNVMVKVHPGLSMWRSILGENIHKAVVELRLDTIFIDVTLVTLNLYNSLIESTSSTEGMKLLIEHMGSLDNGVVVAGEGLNEITMQGLSFAQAHLFKSWQSSIEGIERTGGCDLNQLLFGKLCKIIGYSGLSGKNKDEEIRMKIHLEHGGIPTIVIRRPDEISNPNPAVEKMFDIANGI